MVWHSPPSLLRSSCACFSILYWATASRSSPSFWPSPSSLGTGVEARRFWRSCPALSPYNIAPTQNIPVVRFDNDHRELTTMRWGLIPSWGKDTKIAYSTIKARADTISAALRSEH
jgi:SOS response associated peptidase (SRAP)